MGLSSRAAGRRLPSPLHLGPRGSSMVETRNVFLVRDVLIVFRYYAIRYVLRIGAFMSQKPASKQLEENVQQAVEGAKEEVTAARRPWYEAIHWGFVLIGVYAVQLTLFALLRSGCTSTRSYPLMSPLPRNFRRANLPGCASLCLLSATWAPTLYFSPCWSC